MGSSPENSLMQKCKRRLCTYYIRPKVVGPFPGPYTSGSYMHQTALFFGSCASHSVSFAKVDVKISTCIKLLYHVLRVNLAK
jgi:hypothetical protein